MTLYRHILSQAIKTTWHFKYLWFFGLFAALLGNSGELEIIFRRFNGAPGPGLFPALENLGSTGIFSQDIFINIARLAHSDPFSLFLVLGVLLLVAALSLFLVWLSVASQAAVVNNVARVKADKSHAFKSGLDAGIKNFWPVFGLHIILRLVLYVTFVLLGLPIIMGIGQGGASATGLLFVISFVIFVPLGIVMSFIAKYAIAFVVIKKMKFLNAIKSGWHLFVNNWLLSLEMAFLLFFINFIVGLGLILLILVLTVPFLFIALVLSEMAFYFNFYVIMVSGLILCIGLIATIGAMLSTFQISAWTGLFIELISRGGASKLARVFAKE